MRLDQFQDRRNTILLDTAFYQCVHQSAAESHQLSRIAASVICRRLQSAR